MAERVVSWQAIANFSSIAKEAKEARRELQKLRAEQAALDAQNRTTAASGAAAPNTGRNAQATAAAGNAAADAARQTQRLSDAQRNQVRASRDSEAASRGVAQGYDAAARTAARLSAQNRATASSSNGVVGGLQRLASAVRGSSSSMDSSNSSMVTYARRAREVETSSDGAGRGINRLRSGLAALSPQIKRDQVTILGLARAIALLTVPAVISFINALAASIPPLTAGFIGLAAAIAPITGLLGALPGVMAAAVGGFGTVIAGFSGIGGALKAYQTQQKNAAKTSATSARAADADANKRAGAARKIRKANTALTNAEEKAADTARQNARRISDARRAVTAAREREAEVAKQSARRISDAERAVGDARRRAKEVAIDSARSIANAQRSLADAQRNEADAERGITEARKRAKEQIDDLRKSLRDLRLEEEGTSLSVEEAKLRLQRALNDPASTDLERREAQFNVKEAEARLGDVRDEKKRTDKQLKEANKKGVEGSDEVVEAKRREADAHRGVIDAERDLAETRRDGARAAQEAARSIADAQQNVRDARAAAANDAKDAARGTADAQRNLKEAYADSARATRDANQAVRDAKTGIGDLGDIMKTSTIPAVNEFREAMRKLTPEARAVVMQLIAMKPLLDQLRATAQKGMLPGVLVFLKESVKLFPLFNSFVGTVAQRFGEVFAEIGKAMTTQDAMVSWRKILDSTARVIDSFADAGTNLVFVLGDILEAGGPLTEWLAETVEGWTASWRAMTEGEEGQQRLTAFFEDARKVASQLGRIIGRVSDALFNMGRAFRPVGQFILDGIESLVTRWDEWTKSIEGKNQLKEWADKAIVTLGLMGDVLSGIVEAFRTLGEKVDLDALLITLRDRLVPALERLMGIFTGELLNNLIIIASNIADIVAAFGPEGEGALGAFTDAMVLLTGAMAKIVENKAAVGILTALLTALAVRKAVGIAGTVTGINNIVKSAQTVKKKNVSGGGIGQSGGRVRRTAGNVAATGLQATGLGGFVPARGARTAQPRRAASAPPTRTQRVVAAAARPVQRAASAAARPVQAAAGSAAGAARQAGAKARGVGVSVATGLAKGLSPKAAISAITSVVNSIISIAKKRLGIKSPSAVFQTIGRQIADGLIKGMGSMTGKAKASGAALAGAAASGGKGVAVATGGKGKGAKGTKAGAGKEKGAKGKGLDTGKMASGAAKAGGAISTLVLLLSFLPGKVGEVATSLSTFIFILSLVGPALLKFGGVAIKVMMTVAGVVAKAMLIIGRAMMANPWLLLIGALILVVVLIIKYWDQIKAAIVAAATFIWNWLKKNWPLILKVILGPLGFLIVAIVKHWDKIKATFFTVVHAILNWLKANWPLLLKILLGPLGFAIVAIIKHWDKIRAVISTKARAILAWLKRAWNFIYKYLIDPLVRAFLWVYRAIVVFKNNFLKGIGIIIQGFKDRWNKAKGIVTDAIKAAISAAGKGLKALRDKISEWMGKIGQAWDKFKNAARKPVSWVIDHVINGGIIKAYNWVADRLPGIGPIGKINNPLSGSSTSSKAGGTILKDGGEVPGKRKGGVLRGPGTGTSDSILGINAQGMATARVSAGEYVVREKVTKKQKPLLDAINAGKLGIENFFLGGKIKQPDPEALGEENFEKSLGGLIQRLAQGGRVSWKGGTFTPRFAGILQAINKRIPFRVFQGGFRPASRLSGTSHRGDAVDAGPSTRALMMLMRRAGIAAWQRTRSQGFSPHIHGVPLPGYGQAGGSGVWQAQDYLRGGNGLGGRDTSARPKVSGVKGGLFAPVIDGVKEFKKRVAGSFAELKKRAKGDMLSKLLYAGAKGLKNAAVNEIKKAVESAQVQAAQQGAIPGGGFSNVSGGSNRRIGKKMMLQRWGADQWSALNSLWTKESGWRTNAKNPSSGAYGIPQALPASKMASAGSDWATNPATQIKWGLGYIASRYGSPAKAWAHSQRTNWYAKGGIINEPVIGYGQKTGQRYGFGENGSEVVVPTQALHSGGQVAGFKKGAKGNWVRAIREQIPHASSSQTITSALMDWFKKYNTPPVRDRADFVKDTGMLAKLATALNKSKKTMSVQTAGDKIGRDPYWIWLHYSRMTSAGLDKDLKDRKVSSTKRKALLKSAKSWGSRRTSDVKALEKKLKLPVDGTFDREVADSVAHAMDHAAGYKVGEYGHTALDPVPWDIGVAGLPGLLAEQIRTNRLNAEFDRLLETFRGWGFNALVTKFTEIGPADALTNMRELAKDKNAASQYNAAVQVELDRAAKAEDPTEQQIVKFMEAVRAGTRVGLQGASSAASVSLDTGVKLYDKITSENRWGTIPTSSYGPGSRLYMDVQQFRDLFKFKGGGRVPGRGNRDSVPSLLTPKEFVLRQAAASAIERKHGGGALDYLNNYDKYADGGFVAAGMPTPRLPEAAAHGRRVAASHANEHATKVVNYNFDTTVNNPIAEPTSVSVQKRVQRMARLGLLAGDDKGSNR